MERASQMPSDKDELTDRERDATSKDTLENVAEKEKSLHATTDADDKPPSPDGAFDENRESKDADPWATR